MNTALKRLTEPSTYAGLAVLGTLFGIQELAAIGAPDIIAGLAALAAIFLPEVKQNENTNLMR